MRIIVVPRKQLEYSPIKENDFVISIRAPTQLMANIGRHEKYLFLEFKDDSKDFTEAAAQLIIDLVKRAVKENTPTLWCSCDAGISRSAAVAEFCHRWGFGVWQERDEELWDADRGSAPRFMPNVHVHSTLTRVLMRGAQSDIDIKI